MCNNDRCYRLKHGRSWKEALDDRWNTSSKRRGTSRDERSITGSRGTSLPVATAVRGAPGCSASVGLTELTSRGRTGYGNGVACVTNLSSFFGEDRGSGEGGPARFDDSRLSVAQGTYSQGCLLWANIISPYVQTGQGLRTDMGRNQHPFPRSTFLDNLTPVYRDVRCSLENTRSRRVL